MKQLLFTSLVLLGVTLLSQARGESDHETFVHDAAHFGVSFVLNDFTYGFMNSGMGLDPNGSAIFAGFTTELIGISYKYLEPGSTGPQVLRAMEYNTLGILTDDFFKFMFNQHEDPDSVSMRCNGLGLGLRVPSNIGE